MHLQANYQLDKLNSFALPSKAKYIATVYGACDVQALRSDLVIASLPWKILGSGTNVIIDGDVNAVVIQPGNTAIEIKKEDANNVWVRVGGALQWNDFVRYTVEKGWWGLENLALIPGTVGATPVQNIGAYGVEVRDVITRLQVIDLLQAERYEMRNAECFFEYRNSIFKRKFQNQLLVHKVTFRLKKRGKPSLFYEEINQELGTLKVNINTLTPKNIYDCVVKIRTRKLPNPVEEPNVGSFFKNPVLTHPQLNALLAKVPQAPYSAIDENHYKVHAAWLIETAGWKGYDAGKVQVSAKHSLVLVNKCNGNASNILQLANRIEIDIMEKFNIYLEKEVQIF